MKINIEKAFEKWANNYWKDEIEMAQDGYEYNDSRAAFQAAYSLVRDELMPIIEKQQEALKRLSQSGDGTHGSKKASFYDCLPTLQVEFDERKGLAEETQQWVAEEMKKIGAEDCRKAPEATGGSDE